MEQMSADRDNYKIVIHAEKRPLGTHRGCYNAPITSEVAVLMVDEDCGFRYIVLQSRDSTFKRISELHRSYDPMQYPLIFIKGEDGYNISIPQIIATTGQNNPCKTVSCMKFYAYKLMVRENSFNTLHRYGQLFNQYCVDMATKMITERLNFIRAHQKTLRADNYIHLRDAINEDSNPADMVILPSTFTGSPRYLHERTQDALTYVRNYGRPDLFITFTCNSRWPEIKIELYPNQRPSERHDIVSRVFHLKQLMNTVTKKNIFGPVRCHMFSIEWQKRGLPHAHILIWLVSKINSDYIDSIISAEIPNKDEDPLLYDIVCQNMIHGPCGAISPSSPCMSNGFCSKRYPRQFLQHTETGDDGYPRYRRRCPNDGGHIYIKTHNNFIVDNKWVVPYCPVLSRCFAAHINVEYCHSVQAIKYICKYINKGNDAATFAVENNRDEVQNYINGRYLSTSEGIWRILGFSIHERYPTVVHLENGQRVYFTEGNLKQVLRNPPQTTLTAFFSLCLVDEFARTLFYHKVPAYYTWTSKKWQRRKQGKDVDGYPGIKRDTALGRMFTIHPNYSECFYLRLLLHHVRGPTSFSDLRTVNGEIMSTYRAACQVRNLLESDTHWRDTLLDASISECAHKMRELFGIMLMFCEMSNPLELWNAFRIHLCDDILHRVRQQSNNSKMHFSEEIFNEGLILLENIVFTFGEKRLKEFGLPEPQRNDSNIDNLHYLRETTHNIDDLEVYLQENEVKLNTEQKLVYDEIVNSVIHNKGNIYFKDARGGTGKTFIISLILAKIRSQKKIAIAVASSGIAATLLSGGRTAHSTFKLPLNVSLDQSSVCSVRKNGPTGKLLQQASLIVWDECTMSHKSHIDAVNRTLKDLRKSEKIMGGVTFVFTGDFRQTLPVVPRGTRADIMKVCMKKSDIWQHVRKLRLTINMRVHLRGDQNLEEFAQYLLKIGDGSTSINQNGYINLSDTLGTCVRTIDQVIENVYPRIENLPQQETNWLCERGIVTARNKAADEILGIKIQHLVYEINKFYWTK